MNLRFEQLNKDNYKECVNLKVLENQIGFIEKNIESIVQCAYEKEWKSIAIYDHDMMIGYAMYGTEIEKNRIWLDRFMIDKKFQGRGYSRPVLLKLIDMIKMEYNCTKIYLSIHSENETAKNIYESIGFNLNGEIDCNEDVMVLEV